MPRYPNETIPSQFRLRAETLADLDLIAADLAERTGRPATRTDAVRAAAREAARRLKKNPKNSSKNA